MARRNSASINVNGAIRFVEQEVNGSLMIVRTSTNNGEVLREATFDNHTDQTDGFRKALHDSIDSLLFTNDIVEVP